MKLYFTLENEKMPIDYRRSIISFIKLSLSEYSENEFKKYYNQKDNIIKPYAFSVFFRQPQINGQEIILEDKRFEMNMTIENYETAIIIYNAFNHQKNKKFSINQNSWILQNIVLIPEKEIKENKIVIKFQSPLCVRQREENIALAGKLKEVMEAVENKEEDWKEQVKAAEEDFSEDIIEPLNIIGKAKGTTSQNYQDALKLINARIANLESDLHNPASGWILATETDKRLLSGYIRSRNVRLYDFRIE